MKKLLRVFMWVFIGIIALGVVTAVAIKIFLPPEKAKALLEKELKEKLGREVELGRVEVGLTKGISVRGFKLSEKPTFQQGTFIASDNFSVHVLWPLLLAKKVVIQNLAFEHPQVTVIRNSDGSFNFSDLTATSTSTTPSPSRKDAGSSFETTILKASLTKGQLNFVDRTAAQQSFVIENLDLTTNAISLKAPVKFDLSCVLKVKGQVLNINMESHASLAGNVHIDKATLKSDNVDVNLTGDVKHGVDATSMDVKLAIGKLNVALLPAFVGMPADLTLTGFVAGQLDAVGSINKMSIKPNLDFTHLGINQKGTFIKAENAPLKISGEAQLTGADLSLPQLRLTLGDFESDIRGTVAQVHNEARQLKLDVKTNQFDLPALMAHFPSAGLPADVALNGKTQLTAVLTGPVDRLSYKAHVDGTALAFSYSTTFAKKENVPFLLNARGQRTVQQLTANPFDLTLADAKFDGTFTMSLDPKAPGKSFTLSSAGFPVQSVAAMAPAAAPYQPTGTVALNVKGHIPEKGPMNYGGSLGLKDVAAKYQKSVLTKVNTQLRFDATSVSIPSLTGILDGSPFKISGNATGIGTKMVANVDLNAGVVDLEKIMPDETPVVPQKTDAGGFINIAYAAPTPGASSSFLDKPSALSGRAVIAKLDHSAFMAQNVDLKWNLTNVATDLSHLNGNATLRTGEAQIKKVQEKGKSSVFGRILLAPVNILKKLNKAAGGVAKLPSFDELKFSSVSGDYAFKSGVMSISAFNMMSSEASVTMTGTVALAGAQALNLKVPVSLGRGQYATNTIYLKVGGTVSEPHVGLDASATGKQAVDIIKSGAADNLLKAIGLPGFGKPATPSPPSQKPDSPGNSSSKNEDSHTESGNSEQESPQKAIEGLLKGIFKK